MATSNPIEPIQPVDLPSAAGINYGEGDVRHFAQGDDVSVPGISNPTRQLAERDNRIADKLNEVIQTVNNQEQFVPLPVVPTIVAPVDQAVALNYRIPPGFESRVLNAAVSSTPASADIELDVYYNTGFGGSTGTQVVSTSGEFSGGVNFYQSGEFIVVLKNKSGVTLEMVASVLLTLRPIGSAGTLLVGSTVEGQQGKPGRVGPPGPPGTPGSGGAGTPGMNWTGSWTHPSSYAKNDVVRYDLGGIGGTVSSFIAEVANTTSALNAPQGYLEVLNPWTPVALGGGQGVPGIPGTPGTPGGTPTFLGQTQSVNATFTAGVPFVGAAQEYGAAYAYNFKNASTPVIGPSDSATFPCQQTDFGVATGATKGVAYLRSTIRATFLGWGTIILPTGVSVLGGASTLNYNNSDISLIAATNGTVVDIPNVLISDGSISNEIISYPHPSLSDRFIVYVLNTRPTQVEITLAGMQIIN